uniref:CCHC-type domain-containing protein n=1 Tax=Cyprinus carpio carpio TaxID=630221 RepID=A0A9J8BR64_CYPCA
MDFQTSESRHLIAAFSRRECSRLSNGFHQRPKRLERVNSEGITLCYAYGKAGHIARHCQDNERMKSLVCHACGKDGHIARHFVCFSCGRMGHKARHSLITEMGNKK